MRKFEYVNDSMSKELSELLAGEHAEAIKGLVTESVNVGYKKGIIICLAAVIAGKFVGTKVFDLSKKIISKYQKA